MPRIVGLPGDTNVFVEASTYRNSGSVAIGGVIAIGIFLLLVFANYGFPRLVFRPLGLAYLECQDGSVYLSPDGAEKISRVAADAFPKNLEYPVRIENYGVQIVSKIGKESLLFLTPLHGKKDSISIFVPTKSIIQYQERWK